jgi:hypothetical protein
MMRRAPPAVNEDQAMDAIALAGAMLAQAAALLLTPIMFGALCAGLTRLLWRRTLVGRPWWALAWPAMAVASAVTVAGMAWTGRDGRMATYAAMVAAVAFTLWWRGFGPRRR